MQRREMLDRFDAHTAQCNACRTALRITELQVEGLKWVAASAFLGACLCLGVPALGWVSRVLAVSLVVLSAVSVKFRDLVKLKSEQGFYFADYVHADKN